MQKRLHDKKAGIAILAVIFIISLTDVILRATVFSDLAASITNYGEVLITAGLSALLIIFALKGKDRLVYILCGVWLGCFVFDQLFGLPALIAAFVSTQANGFSITLENIGILLHIVGMIGIIAIGILLVEYMNDGSICNKAFNFFCIASVLMFLLHSVYGIYGLLSNVASLDVLLAILSNLQRIAMVFLFTFFAYDSAKIQLRKTKLS